MNKFIYILSLCFIYNLLYADLKNEGIEYKLLNKNYPLVENNYYIVFENLESFDDRDYFISDNQAIVTNYNKNNFSSDIPSKEIMTNLFEFKLISKNIFLNDKLVLIFKKHFNKNWIIFSTDKPFVNKIDFFKYYFNNYIIKNNSIKNVNHHKLNFKLNAWILNESKTDLLNKYHYIFYTPQFFYESGLIISFIIITLFFFFLVTYFLRLIIKRKVYKFE